MTTWSYECRKCSHEHVLEVYYERGAGIGDPQGYVFAADTPTHCVECGEPLPSESKLNDSMQQSMMDSSYD